MRRAVLSPIPRHSFAAVAATGATPLLAAASAGSAVAQGSAPAESPFLQRSDEGRKVWAMGVQVTFRATGEATGGSYAMFKALMPSEVSNPAHIHTRKIET